MRALLLDQNRTLRIGDLPVPEPGPGQVRVRVEACGLNPVDHQLVKFASDDRSWPHVLGLDVAGIVDALGADVDHVRAGQRVAYHGDLRRRGGFAEYAVADAATLVPVPDALEPATAAAVPTVGMTAYQAMVRRLHITADHAILVTGGAGGIGGHAVQLVG